MAGAVSVSMADNATSARSVAGAVSGSMADSAANARSVEGVRYVVSSMAECECAAGASRQECGGRGQREEHRSKAPNSCAMRGSPGTVPPRASSGHHFFFACPTWGHLGHHRGSRRLCSVISAFSPCRRWGTPRASPHLGLAPGGAITVMPVRGPRGHRARATGHSTLCSASLSLRLRASELRHGAARAQPRRVKLRHDGRRPAQ